MASSAQPRIFDSSNSVPRASCGTQRPVRSTRPSAVFGTGADRFGRPSGPFGTTGDCQSNHWAWSGPQSIVKTSNTESLRMSSPLDFAGPSGAGRRSAGGTSSAGSAEHYTIGTETRLRPFLEPGGYMRLRLLRAPTLAATVLTAALASSNAGAHHSFSAEFDIGRPVEITGTVTKIEW